MPFLASASIYLNVSPEVAFDRLADHPSWAEWMPRSFRPVGHSQGPLRFDRPLKMRIGGLPFPAIVRVMLVDRPTEITWGGGVPGVIRATHRFFFDKEGDGTRVRSEETWQGPLEKLLRPVILPMAEKIGRDQLEALQKAVRG